MRKGKVEIEGPWVWTKLRMRSDMEDYFIIEGVLLILIYFILVLTIRGPYIRTNIRYFDGGSISTEVPIWIVFLYSGSTAILIGLSLKAPRLFMRPRLLRFSTLLAGLVLACVNLFGMAVYFQFWFMNVDIGVFYWLSPVLLFSTCYVSSTYLYFQGSPLPRLMILPQPNPIPESKRHILF